MNFRNASLCGLDIFESKYKKQFEFITNIIENSVKEGNDSCRIQFPTRPFMKMVQQMLIDDGFKTTIIDDNNNQIEISWKHHIPYNIEDYNDVVNS